MKKINTLFFILIFNIFVFNPAKALQVKVQDGNKHSLPLTMVTVNGFYPTDRDYSDNGYPAEKKPFVYTPDITRLTNELGLAELPVLEKNKSIRFRKYGYKDKIIELNQIVHAKKTLTVSLEKETDPVQLANSKPANIWLAALDVGSGEDKIHFKMQCAFCHQQGTSYMRTDRTEDEWKAIIKRMVRYGSRLPSDLQDSLPKKLSEGFKTLVTNPKLLAEPQGLNPDLTDVTIREWLVGDSMSQTHDTLVSQKSGLIYVADNIQDRLYELNLKTNEITVYKIPHYPNESNGGLLSARLKEFPKHDSTSNAHSLAESQVDGHIFITPSAQRRLVEFNPVKKEFTLHELDQGFYPHTIRVDQKDRVWFTLALSNQVACFDRTTKSFTYYDLPARSFKEKLITQNISLLFKLMSWGLPLSNWLKIDRESSGVPLAYGIDVTPDGKIWVARLHAKDIISINPDTKEIKSIPTPFFGPRRLRTDTEGHLWIVSYGESKLVEYNPDENKFTPYDLPVFPIGSDTPYSLNVDKKNKRVWVTGNQSDSVYVFNMINKSWRTIPLPRRTTFTRDFEFDENGTAYTANSNFPSWQIEGAQPTLIEIKY